VRLYSGVDETSLQKTVREKGITRVGVAGVATEGLRARNGAPER